MKYQSNDIGMRLTITYGTFSSLLAFAFLFPRIIEFIFVSSCLNRILGEVDQGAWWTPVHEILDSIPVVASVRHFGVSETQLLDDDVQHIVEDVEVHNSTLNVRLI